MPDFEAQSLVEMLVRDGHIRTERVRKAMLAVPRHLFVPQSLRDSAYDDRPLPIGYGQTISQPAVVAMMTEALEVELGHRVLEVGTGSGYQAAVLAELGAEVYGIEVVPELAREAEQRLVSRGYRNVHVRAGDGYLGWPEEAPFDRIIITAAPPELPRALAQQLADGGILVAPVGGLFWQQLLRFRKSDGELTTRDLGPVRLVPMVPAA